MLVTQVINHRILSWSLIEGSNILTSLLRKYPCVLL